MNQQNAQYVIWMAKGYRGETIQPKIFTKYRLTVPSRRTINLRYQLYKDRGSHSHRYDNEGPRVRVKIQNRIEEMSKAETRRSLREVGAVVGVHHTIVWHSLGNKFKRFHNRLQVVQRQSETDKGTIIAFAQLFKEKWKENPRVVNKRCCRIWGSQRLETVYESPQSSATLLILLHRLLK